MARATSEPLGWPTEGIQEHVLQIMSGNPDGFFNLANGLQGTGKSFLIQTAYELAIEHGVEESFLNYGNYLADRGRGEPACAMRKCAYETGNDRAAVLVAQQYVEEDELGSAEEWYEKATHVPESALLHSRLKTTLGKTWRSTKNSPSQCRRKRGGRC